MHSLGFGQYRTLKLKIPRQCCPWCEFYVEQTGEQVKVLEEKVAALEANLKLHQANLSAELRVETTNFLLKRLTDGPTAVTPDPSQFAHIYELYQRIIEMAQGPVPESNRLLQNGSVKEDGAAIRALKEGTEILSISANLASQPRTP